MEEDIKTTESHVLPFVKLKAATNDFSNENKLGEGRFGPVYKVRLASIMSCHLRA